MSSKIDTTALEQAEVLGMTDNQIGGPCVQRYNEGGQLDTFLPSASILNEIEQLGHDTGFKLWVRDQIILLRARQIFGSGPKQYVYTFDELDDPAIIPYAQKSVSPRPSVDGQVRVFKNGKQLEYEVDYTVTATGVKLTADLISGENVMLEIMSTDEADAIVIYYFDGTYGSGSGAKVFTLSDLGADTHGQSITTFPASSFSLRVIKNGLRQGKDADYTVTGSGSSTVVTFVLAVEPEDSIWFEIINIT